jgi:hypothetical protein
MNRRGRKKAPLQANYSIANYLKTDSKAMVTQILDTPIENAVNNSKIVATEIIDDILKGTVKTDNNSTKRKHSVTDKTFVTWKEIFPLLCKVEKTVFHIWNAQNAYQLLPRVLTSVVCGDMRVPPTSSFLQ